MKVLVMGFGPHGAGLDAAEYYHSYGHEVTIYDSRHRDELVSMAEKLESLGIETIFEGMDSARISEYDIIVKAPTIPLNIPMLREAKIITNDLSALLDHPALEKMKIICIVGSGKTKTASAIQHALNLSGCRAALCGSVGISGFHVLKEIQEKGDDYFTHIIIEMTSWQIMDTAYAMYNCWPDIDVVLFTKKKDDGRTERKEIYNIFGPWVKKAIIDKELKNEFLQKTGFNKKNLILAPTGLNPKKGQEPFSSAFEVLHALGLRVHQITRALSSYKGIPNRMEQIAFRDSMLWINDSASTIPASVLISVKKIGPANLHIICGGSERTDTDPSPFRQIFKSCASITLLSGRFTDKLVQMLEKSGRPYAGPFDSMEDAVRAAKKAADEANCVKANNQIILLSPGASSFEYFENSFNRGDEFRVAVADIIEKHPEPCPCGTSAEEGK